MNVSKLSKKEKKRAKEEREGVTTNSEEAPMIEKIRKSKKSMDVADGDPGEVVSSAHEQEERV